MRLHIQALLVAACTWQLSLPAVTARSYPVFWEYHAWNRSSGEKLSTGHYPKELPATESDALRLICETLSALPREAELLALSGNAFHPALNRFCQTSGLSCVYTDSQVGRHMPSDWQYNAINFYPASELRSQSIYEFLKWSAWTEFAVLYTGFHDLERMQTLLPFPNGQVVFRTMNLDNASLTFRLLTQLKLSTVHRFVLALPQSQVPKFLNLASAANLTSMAYNFLLVGGMNGTFFREHVSSRLFSGMNFTSHQFDGITLLDASPGAKGIGLQHELSRPEAINRLLYETYSEWRRGLQSLGRHSPFVFNQSNAADEQAGRHLRVHDGCFIRLGDNTTSFHDLLDNNIRRRIGEVTIAGRRVYNFSFCVNHMYTETQPKVSWFVGSFFHGRILH